MSFHKLTGKIILLSITVLLLQSCTQGLQGGSIEKEFSGIRQATVLGPETVEIGWTTNSNCTNYKIYLLSSSTVDSVADAALSPVRLKAPTIQSSQPYTFAVGCVSGEDITGQDVTIAATTWAQFNGVVTSFLDKTATIKLVTMNWSFQENSGTIFQVFAKPSLVPGDLSTWQLTHSGGVGSGYTETPICETSNNKLTIGPGGDCPASSLNSGTTYNFKVVAKYPDGKYSTDFQGNGTTETLPPAFTPPNCVLTQAGVGADSISSYLFLRCGAVSGTDCPNNNYITRVYQTVGSSRVVVSDALSGAGTLRIQPQISANSADTRTVSGLEVEYTCASMSNSPKAVVRYDGTNDGNGLHKKPVLKYGDDGYVKAPKQSYEQHPSQLGSVMAVGDFNCDGKPDMAIGLPDITFNTAPYLNKNARSGAVKIIYDYANSATSSFNTSSVEYLSFRDLAPGARFGASLAVGNINKDVNRDASNNLFSCDDLIIGAPGNGASNALSGAAYIFFGHPQGFPQPFDQSGLAVNAPTCSGDIKSQVCAPVRLAPDLLSWYHVDPNYSSDSVGSNLTTANGGTNSVFGYKVAYVRDFNADGYGDVVVTDPNCSWDGENQNSVRNINGGRITIGGVGCAYVFWGGPAGLQIVHVGKTPDAVFDLDAPFVKIYPPFPQANMHFGKSVAGGGDVDGRLPVPIQMDGGSKIVLATGNDFVIGAPDYQYVSTPDQGPNTTELSWIVDEFAARNGSGCIGTSGGTCPVDPLVMRGPGFFDVPGASIFDPPGSKLTPPWNGAWSPNLWFGAGVNGAPVPANSNLQGSTGIAFLYLGRSPLMGYELTIDQTGYNKYPNEVQEALPGMEDYLSRNIRDRQNGSQFLKIKGGMDWKYAPTDSFYNCGNRGSPYAKSNSANTYKHISCLAGRNNFSVIYPSLKTGSAGTAVAGFGTNLSIAGAKEQNIIALFEEHSSVDESAYHRNQATQELKPLAQSNTHDLIRGTSLWEVGLQGLTTPGSTSLTCELFNHANNPTTVSTDCPNYAFHLGRSSLTEEYDFSDAGFLANPMAKPLTDVNSDGYADVVIATGGSTSSVFTYYGNYAADFSYQGNNNTTSASCNVERLNGALTTPFSYFASKLTSTATTTTLAPFTTFFTYSTATHLTGGASANSIKAQYPEYFLPDAGKYSRLSYLDEAAISPLTYSVGSGINYNYQTVTRGSISSKAGSTVANTPGSCLPLLRSYTSAVTSLASADMNNDAIIDEVIGLGNDGSNKSGKVVVAIAGSCNYPYSSGTNCAVGFTSEGSYTVSPANSLVGSAAVGSNWKFLDGVDHENETGRRDLFAGAPGYSGGEGRIFDFSGSNSPITLPLSTAPTYTLLEDSNFPNTLMAQLTKIVGDLNGDGYDDMLTPVRRVANDGSVYYDAIIYYGSAYGPVTYSFCSSKLSSIVNSGGSPISLADCRGTAIVSIATINKTSTDLGTQIALPQYLSLPTGVSPNWILSAHPAGDVNHDGSADLLLLDYDVSAMYLYFGSTSGLINGSPRRGPSTTLTPQLVTNSFMNFSQGINGVSQTKSSWVGTGNGVSGYWSTVSYQNYPLATGDYNGDGYQDIAITVNTSVPGHNVDTVNPTGWTCSAAQLSSCTCLAPGCPHDPVCCANPSGPHVGGFGTTHNAVIVIYGGAAGYQTPINSATQNPVEFDGIGMTNCPNFYDFTNTSSTGCTYSGTLSTDPHKMSYIREVYDILAFSSSTQNWTIDTTRTACSHDVPTNTDTCRAEVIRNPVFYNTPNSPGNFYNLDTGTFGNSLTTADVNHDGIDDLVVTDPNNFLPGYSTSDKTAVFKDNTVWTGNSSNQGAAFIYYGAFGAGLVAPNASSMVGDIGLGISDSTAAGTGVTNSNSTNGHIHSPIFSIYPAPATGVVSSESPELDGAGGVNREFGMTTSAGDFNGDGYDDLAVVSAKGQVYIYYGPLCQIDNSTGVWVNTVYKNHSTSTTGKTTQSVTGSVDCDVFDLKTNSPAFTTGFHAAAVSSSQLLFPQMLYVTGASATNGFASALLSRRPIRGVASAGPVVKNPGNLDGDPENTSDLVLGSPQINDPNVTSPANKVTGIGYIFFGHKPGSTSDLPTTPGIFIGPPSYNSSLVSKTVLSNTYYYHQPVILHPHTSDGQIGKFFQYETTMGDLNGDGTGDLFMPTSDIQDGAEGEPVITGGGGKVFY